MPKNKQGEGDFDPGRRNFLNGVVTASTGVAAGTLLGRGIEGRRVKEKAEERDKDETNKKLCEIDGLLSRGLSYIREFERSENKSFYLALLLSTTTRLNEVGGNRREFIIKLYEKNDWKEPEGGDYIKAMLKKFDNLQQQMKPVLEYGKRNFLREMQIYEQSQQPPVGGPHGSAFSDGLRKRK